MEKNQLPTKRELKDFVNKNGFFNAMKLNLVENEAGDSGVIHFRGIASNGDLNRNGYRIDQKAWKSAIDGYMENPVILLQHDSDKPIGKATSAKITSKGLEVTAVLFEDQMPAESLAAFKNGVLKGLSTGHITLDSIFENEKTGKSVKKKDIGTEGNPGWLEVCFDDAWKVVVTALEWLEFSLVSIPANRKSMVTEKNGIETERDVKKELALKNGVTPEEIEAERLRLEKNSVEEQTEEKPENTPEEPEEKPEDEVEKDGETPSDDEPEAENAEVVEPTEPEETPAEETEESEGETQKEDLEVKPDTGIELNEMVKHLAKNILTVEEKLSDPEVKPIDRAEVAEIVKTQIEETTMKNLADLSGSLEKLKLDVEKINARLDKQAVNRPMAIQQVAAAAKPIKWA